MKQKLINSSLLYKAISQVAQKEGSSWGSDQVIVLIFKQPFTGPVLHPMQHTVGQIVAFLVLIKRYIPVQSSDPVLHYQGVGIGEAGNGIHRQGGGGRS